MTITAKQVRELRLRSGAGMMDCKKALVENDGDMDAAAEWLQVKGISDGDKRSGRAADEGYIASYIHHDGKLGVIVEVGCETDFVARNETFREFARNVAMHIAAHDPQPLEGSCWTPANYPLLTQPFVMDTDVTVGEARTELASKLGENVVIKRFQRFQVGGD